MHQELKTRQDVRDMLFNTIQKTCEEIEDLVRAQLELRAWLDDLTTVTSDASNYYLVNGKISRIRLKHQEGMLDLKKEQLNELLELVV